MDKKSSLLKVLFGYAGKHKYLSIASWILSGISAILALVPFVYIWLIIKEVINVMPNMSEAVNITHYGWMAVLFSVLTIAVNFSGLMCSHLSAFRIASNMRIKTITHITSLPIGALDNFGSGKARRTVNESSAATESFLAHQLPDFSAAITTAVGMIVLLFVFDWRLGLISLAPTIIGFIIMSAMTGKRMQVKMKEYNNSLGDMNNEAVEYIRGIPVVKTFGQSVHSFKRFKDSIDNYNKWVVSYTKELRAPMNWYTLAINAVFVVLIIAGMIMAGGGKISSENLLNLIFYIVYTPIISVTMTKIMFMSENKMIAQDALQRVNTILSMKTLDETEKPINPSEYSVSFDDVSFSYDGVEKKAVNGISFTVEQGQTIALVGPSGGGKSTVAGLISRFWDVDSGSVRIGGVNVKDMSKQDLMKTISFVFQNSKLLKTSIFENVRLSNPNATKEEVLDALHIAQCDDIVEKLPNGIDTVIGTKGVYLSGGEIQRIAIARVVLKHSPIIIMDEATAFADPENEYKVQRAFSDISKNKTVIMIAHRLSSIKNVDKIFVLKDGQIVENGTHEQLVKENGVYKKMWKDYQTSISWKVAKEVKQ